MPRGISKKAKTYLLAWKYTFSYSLAPAAAEALVFIRVVPARGPTVGLSLAGPSGVGLGLHVLPWFRRVWTRSITRPVSRTVRLLTEARLSAPGLSREDANTSPSGSGDTTLGSCT